MSDMDRLSNSLRTTVVLGRRMVAIGLLTYAMRGLAAEPFRIVDAEGVEHGLFVVDPGTDILLHGRVYRVATASDAGQQTEAALRTTLLPPCAFRDATLPDIVRFVREQAGRVNTGLAGVTFVVETPRSPDAVRREVTPGHAGDDVAAASPPSVDATLAVPSPVPATISLTSESLPAWELLDTAANAFGYRLTVNARSVHLRHPHVAATPLYRRSWNVHPWLSEQIAQIFEPSMGCFCIPPLREHGIEFFLEILGFDWPEGSWACDLSGIGRFAVANTLPNLQRIEQALAMLLVRPLILELECQTIEVPKGLVESAARVGRLPTETLLEFLRDGKATVLASPKVLTRNGSEAELRAVVEVLYPTEFKVEPVTDADGTARPTIEPMAFEQHEVGNRFVVVPDVTPDGTMVSLQLMVSRTEAPEWGTAGQAGGVPGGQPWFPVDTISTHVSVRPGESVLVGGGTPTRDGRAFVYRLVTALLLDPSGRTVPEPDVASLFAPPTPPPTQARTTTALPREQKGTQP